MGVQGLLHFLEKATRPFHVSEFKGATVAIDAYFWLAKGSLEAINTDQITNYCIQYLQLLQYNEIRPILVFNGQDLPLIEASKGKISKKSWRAVTAAGSEQGAKSSSYKQDINIVPELATIFIKKCHELKIDCIVAPYESAAQLAFFNLRGIAELVVSEDPDLILYGCSKICLKLNIQGDGLLLDCDLICDAIKLKSDHHTFDKFKHMCILSGCAYIPPLEGMNLNKAHQFISLTEDTNPETFLDTIPNLLSMPNLQVSQEYKMNFMMVDAIYRHQIIFDPFTKKMEPLFDPHIAGTNPELCKYAGEIYDQDKAYQVALGNLHPAIFQQLDNWNPKQADLNNKSIWGPGPYERSPWRNQQKDSFKEYFSNYKFETIEETDIDDSTIKTEEENKTNSRTGMEINSHFSGNPSLTPCSDTEYYDGGSFPICRNNNYSLPSESNCFLSSRRDPSSMPVSVLETEIMPVLTPPTKMPRSVPQTRMPGIFLQTAMPGFVPPTARMPGIFPQTRVLGTSPLVRIRGIPQTRMPILVPQTKMPGFPSQTRMPGTPSQTRIPLTVTPGLIPLTVMPTFVQQTVVPGLIVQPITPISTPQTVFDLSASIPTSDPTEVIVGGQQTTSNTEENEDGYIRQFSAIDFVEAVYDKEVSDQNEDDKATKEFFQNINCRENKVLNPAQPGDDNQNQNEPELFIPLYFKPRDYPF